LYLQKEDMPRKQERRGHTLSVVQNLLKGLVNIVFDFAIFYKSSYRFSVIASERPQSSACHPWFEASLQNLAVFLVH
jgi:hypothetical protein